MRAGRRIQNGDSAILLFSVGTALMMLGFIAAVVKLLLWVKG